MTLRYAHLAPNHLDMAVNALNAIMPDCIKTGAESKIADNTLRLVEKAA